jgi:iron complex outermembrane receptor protein
MKTKDGTLLGVTLLAALSGGQGLAQEGPNPPAEEVVVIGERVARGNNVISAAQMEALPAAQNIVDAVKLVPGVQIRSGDASNNDPWSYAINIRGYEVNLRNSKIGQTLDGVPLFNASYYLGGAPAQKFILAESLERIQVNQGTADVGSTSSAALGGTIAYFSRDPSEEAGGLLRGTFGSFDSRRYFGRYDVGSLFGNTRAYVAIADLDAPLWPHEGSTPAAIEQFAVEGKSVSDFGKLTLTLYGSYNDSDDDPIIEATRTFIDNTQFKEDGSTAVFNTTDAAANEYWADEWAAIRKNTLGYAKFAFEANDVFSFDITPYAQRNEGVGEFIPPAIRPRMVTSGGVTRQVLFGGVEVSSSARATRVNAAGFGVQPYNGVTTVRSSDCFNPGNTLKVGGNGLPLCSSAQSYRNSTYYHKRLGVVANGKLDLGAHKVRFGAWYENLDRDFGRVWRQYSDIRLGPVGVGGIYRRDFEQNFQTDLWKFHIADDWAITDRLTLSLGLQHYLVDIKGTSVEAPSSATVLNQFDADGNQTGVRRLAVNSDSDELLPAVGIVFDATDSLQLFAGYSKNFGAIGDWALEKTGTDLSSLKPEVSSNYEAGFRYRGDRLRGAATVYHN